MKLEIELIPKTGWGANLRWHLHPTEWDVIRKACYKKADYKCEICGGKGKYHPVECHERWEFDDENRVQKLVGVIALCPSCHEVKHYGRTSRVGRHKEAMEHLMQVNKISETKALRHIEKSYEVWQERSKHKYELDMSLVEKLLKDEE